MTREEADALLDLIITTRRTAKARATAWTFDESSKAMDADDLSFSAVCEAIYGLVR